MEYEISNNLYTNKTKYLSMALFMGISFDLLFYNNFIGLNYIIYAVLFLIAIFLNIRHLEDFENIRYILVSFLILYLSTSFFRTRFEFINLLNFILIPVLFSLLPSLSMKNRINTESYLLKGIRQLMMPLGGFVSFISNLAGLILKNSKKKNNFKHKSIFIGVVLSIILLLFILPLMLSADMIFNTIFYNFTENLFININFSSIIGHLIIIFLVSSYMMGFLEKINKDKLFDFDMKSVVKFNKQLSFDSKIIINIILFTLNIIFLIFSYVQIRYIVFKGTGFLPNDITYAEYARSGFFQMMVLSVINFGIATLIRAYTSKLEKTKSIQILLTTLSIFTIIMIYSSFSRMQLYENMYGYTRQRFFVYIILSIETGLNILLIYAIYNKKFTFIRYSLVSAFILYLVLNMINIDGYIANKNITRYFETTKLDVEYLIYGLSNDAAPEIYKLRDVDDPFIKAQINKYFTNVIISETSFKSNVLSMNLSGIRANNIAQNYFSLN